MALSDSDNKNLERPNSTQLMSLEDQALLMYSEIDDENVILLWSTDGSDGDTEFRTIYIKHVSSSNTSTLLNQLTPTDQIPTSDELPMDYQLSTSELPASDKLPSLTETNENNNSVIVIDDDENPVENSSLNRKEFVEYNTELTTLLSFDTKDKKSYVETFTEKMYTDLRSKLNEMANWDFETNYRNHKPSLKMSDISTLIFPNMWLNDRIINAYMKLIADENPGVYAFDTFLMPAFCESSYDKVSKWVKEDIFNKKKLLVPIIANQHWTLVCVDVENKILNYMDSLNPSNESSNTYVSDHLRTFIQFYHSESLFKKKVTVDINQWSIDNWKSPRQTNYHDCGVFLCQNALSYTGGNKPTYEGKDINLLRIKMTQELYYNKLL